MNECISAFDDFVFSGVPVTALGGFFIGYFFFIFTYWAFLKPDKNNDSGRGDN